MTRETVLSLDEIFAKPDVPAMAPIPPRSDEQIHRFESADGLEASCHSERGRVEIRTIGELNEVHPTVCDHGHLRVKDLKRFSDVEGPAPFKPKWLATMLAPRLLPRLYDLPALGTVMRPLSFEQAAQDYPWCTVGKVFVQRRGQNTRKSSGVLVGPNLLLTSSHSMPWDTDDWSVRFVPNYRNGNDPRFGHAYVDRFRGVRNEERDVTGLDYVVCQLNWRIGDRTGWMGTRWTSDEDWYYDNSWLSAGYPGASPSGGEMPSAEVPVWVKDIDGDDDGLEIETIHFTNKGWSGGPLWGELGNGPHVIGIDSGKEKDGLDPTRGVFAGGEHMVNLVKYGWANWV